MYLKHKSIYIFCIKYYITRKIKVKVWIKKLWKYQNGLKFWDRVFSNQGIQPVEVNLYNCPKAKCVNTTCLASKQLLFLLHLYVEHVHDSWLFWIISYVYMYESKRRSQEGPCTCTCTHKCRAGPEVSDALGEPSEICPL